MPEKKGIVTGFIQNPRKNNEVFGLNLDGTEYLYSFEDYRGEPFEADMVEVGSEVRVEYQDTTDKAGKPKKYVSVLEVVLGGSAPEAPQAAPGAPGWGFEQKDRLMCRESCLKTAGNIYAASIKAGHFEHHPPHGLVTDYAAALEKWCLGAVTSGAKVG